MDPWDQNTWLGPWQLVEKNLYTEMCITLGICYSLQLTERFSSSDFEIHNAGSYMRSSYASKIIKQYLKAF